MGRGKTKDNKNDVWASRETFWNLERVKRGYKIREIAELLDMGEKIVSAYFTGFVMPDDDTVAKFCDLFEIDFMRGKGEFFKSHREYKNTHDRKCKLRFNSAIADVAPIPPVKPEVEEINFDNLGDKVMEMLYNKIPYADFKMLAGQIMSGADILECVYGKVDYDTFVKVREIVQA